MQALQQIVEHKVGFVFGKRPSGKGAAQRRGDSGLVGQAFHTDYSTVHVKLGRLLGFSFDCHLVT